MSPLPVNHEDLHHEPQAYFSTIIWTCLFLLPSSLTSCSYHVEALLVPKCDMFYKLSPLPGILPSPILHPSVRLTFICPLTTDLGCFL